MKKIEKMENSDLINSFKKITKKNKKINKLN